MKNQTIVRKQPSTLEDAIVELYLSVKIRKQEEIEKYNEQFLEIEKEKLRKANPITLIGYIKNSIEILIDLKVLVKMKEKETSEEEFYAQYGKDEGINQYEKLLRKAEADIRNYIKIEHQLKLFAETLQIKGDEMERTIEELKAKCNRIESSSPNSIKPFKQLEYKYTEEDFASYRKEIGHLQQIIKSYEQHNLKIPVLERKLRNQKVEMKNMDSFYKDQLRSFSKKLEKYEEVIKCGQKNPLSSSIVKLSEENSNPRASNSNISRGQSRNKGTNISIRGITHSPDTSSKTHRTKEVDYVISNPDLCQKKTKDSIHTFINDLRESNEKDKSLGPGMTINQTARENTIDMSKIPEEKSGIITEIKTSYQPHRRNDSSLMKKMQTVNTVVNTAMQNPPKKKKIESSLFSKNVSRCVDVNVNQKTSRDTSHEARKKLISSEKKIHSMMPTNTQHKEQNLRRNNTNPNQTFAPNIKDFQYMSTKFLKNNNLANQNNYTQVNQSVVNNQNQNSSILPNQQAIPCYNNINIFAGGVNNVKAGGLNLRQFIFNKICNKKVNAGSMKDDLYEKTDHARSTSTLGNN